MDMKTKPVVAAVDFSSSSRQVLIHAARIAEFTGAPLIVAHVVSESRLRDWESTMGRSFDIAKGLAETTARLLELGLVEPHPDHPGEHRPTERGAELLPKIGAKG